MTILALITRPDQIDQVIPWSAAFARALDTRLIVLVWAYARTADLNPPPAACASLLSACQGYIDLARSGNGALQALLAQEAIEFRAAHHPRPALAAAALAEEWGSQLMVAAASDRSGRHGSRIATNTFLRVAPCHAVLLFGGPGRAGPGEHILAGSNDGANDAVALFLASRLAKAAGGRATLGRVERAFGQVGLEVGRRDLRALIREADIDLTDELECRVLRSNDTPAILALLQAQDLVLLGAGNWNLEHMIARTTHPTYAVIRRTPAHRYWRRGQRPIDWITGLSTTDYAELYRSLRQGSRLSVDFLTMLCLAAVVASLGLLQNSPAVVIGSMLLAPLMTPMLGCGLALAQANPSLGNRALASVATGLSFTLLISAVIGLLAPTPELTPQILDRGDPTSLDLLVATASAAAAAYALARPSLVGSIAGVAIATALMPPLCSVGLSLAYSHLDNARGAALLFFTNFVAIVLAAAFTFRVMGVTSDVASRGQQRWVQLIGAGMLIGVLAVTLPLYASLQRSVYVTTPQPITYPLSRHLMEGLEHFIQQRDDVELIAAGRPSSLHARGVDVYLVLGASGELERSFGQSVADIVRHRMNDPSLVVEIHCIPEQWRQRFE